MYNKTWLPREGQTILGLMALGLCVLATTRSAFILSNYILFKGFGLKDLVSFYFYGIRFDVATLMYVLMPVWLILFFRNFSSKSHINNRYIRICSATLLTLVLLIELFDCVFYKYAQRRSILADSGLFANTISMLPSLLKQYWYLIILFGIGVWLIFRVTKIFVTSHEIKDKKPRLFRILWFLVFVFVSIIISRGGFQMRPMTPLASSGYVSESRWASILTNTTFNLIHSVQQRSLSISAWPNQERAAELFPIHHEMIPKTIGTRPNFVVIVVESLSKEYMGKYNSLPYTPFLDSLIDQSLTYEESLANATRSASGIISIVAGLPSLMDDPWQFSSYQTDKMPGIPYYLHKLGYKSVFYHGAVDGTMDFARSAIQLGFDTYKDKDDYPDQTQFDGRWGIYDSKFIPFFKSELDKLPQPFFGLVFTLSNHHPYKLPKEFEGKYADMDPQYRAVLYTDQVLRDFFVQASQSEWYKNTIFIITGDHTGPVKDPNWDNPIGKYSVPLVFYAPDGRFGGLKKGKSQQIDILPFVLTESGYAGKYSSFDSPLTKAEDKVIANYDNGVYRIIQGDYLLLADQNSVTKLYNFKQDRKLTKDLKEELPAIRDRMNELLQAYRVQHNIALIKNTWSTF